MRYYVDEDVNDFLEENVEAIIELIKKAYLSTKEYYNNKIDEDFLYMNTLKTFNKGYCFYFARMLKSVYKNAEFVVADKHYAHISHIYIYINGYMYDVNGKRKLKKYYVLTNEELRDINLNHMPINNAVYCKFKDYFYKYLNEYMRYNNKHARKSVKNTQKVLTSVKNTHIM